MTRPLQTGVWLALLVVGLAGYVGYLFYQSALRPTDPNAQAYTIMPGFTTETLNTQMLVGPQGWHPDTILPLPQLVGGIRRAFRYNPHPEAVLHGNAALVPVGWAFVAVRNATEQPQALVLSMPQARCTQATLWAGRGDRLTLVGTLRNTTPLGDRFYPFLYYAFPLTIPPQATVPLLLRTQDYAGSHEVDVRLSAQRTYATTAFFDNLRDGATLVLFLVLGLIALLVGGLAGSQLLAWFGVYLVALSVMNANLMGLLSLLHYPAWMRSAGLALNADTVGMFCRIWINPMIHPFFYALIKPAVRHRRRYWWVVGIYSAVSGGLMALHLLPLRYYDQLNYGINLSMTTLTLLNVGWLLVWAVLAYRRARIWSPLATCLLGLTPIILAQFVGVLRAGGGPDTYRQVIPSPLFLLLLLSYLTFEQFRKELVTRQRMQSQVREATEQNDTLRRQEIEGIGRDLHDQVGNTLATALGYLGRASLNPDKLRSIILAAIGELRFLSHNLVKDDERPLTDKVETLVSRFNDFAPVRLAYTDYTQGQINQLAALKQQNLYRIVQELLTNVIRHSGATQATVQFFCDGTTVDVSVEDDGVGFDLSASEAKGIGIQTIHKRAALSGISVQFDAAPTGTSVLLQTPLNDFTRSDAHPNHSY